MTDGRPDGSRRPDPDDGGRDGGRARTMNDARDAAGRADDDDVAQRRHGDERVHRDVDGHVEQVDDTSP